MNIKGKTFVLAGNFECGDKFVAVKQMIEMAGGHVKDGLTINKSVDYLVLGAKGSPSWKKGECPQVEQVETAKKRGQNIAVVSEESLLHSLKNAGITIESWLKEYKKKMEEERKRLKNEIDSVEWKYDSRTNTLTIKNGVLPDFLSLIEDAEHVGLINASIALSCSSTNSFNGSDGSSEAASIESDIPGNSKMREYDAQDMRQILPWSQYADEMEVVYAPNLIEVPSALFAWSAHLISAHLPKARIVGNSAFYECKELDNIVLPEVVTIGNGAFALCRSLNGTLLCPKLQHIGPIAFSDCKALTGIKTTKPDRMRIDGKVFKGSGSSLQSIGKGAFLHCESLKSVSYDEDVCLVHDSAFHQSGIAKQRTEIQ